MWQWHIAELLWSHSQVDTANLSSRWGSLTLVGCSSPGRKTLIPNLRYLAAKPNLGKGFGSKPRYEIRSWSPEGSSSLTSTSFWQLLRQHWCQVVWAPTFPLDVMWRGGDPLCGQQLVFHIILAWACALERILQCCCKVMTTRKVSYW